MVRQAHTYLAGAISGSALVGAAVVAFVLLVSLQALRDWPLAGIGGGDDGTAVSKGRPATAGAATAAAQAVAGAGPAAKANAGRGAGAAPGRRQHVGVATVGAPSSPGSSTGSPAGEAPSSTPPAGGGSGGPTTSQPAESSSGGGGNGGGGPAPGTGGGGPGGSTQSTSGAVTGAVNNTVAGVDQALGGAGVTKTTEEVVNNVAGPESTVGETVDKVGETLGGLLGGHR